MLKFFQNKEEVGHLDFPITQAGTTSVSEIIIENVSIDPVRITFYSEDTDLSIQEDYPKVLQPGEKNKVKLLFSPGIDRPSSMKNAKWGFREIDG